MNRQPPKEETYEIVLVMIALAIVGAISSLILFMDK